MLEIRMNIDLINVYYAAEFQMCIFHVLRVIVTMANTGLA